MIQFFIKFCKSFYQRKYDKFTNSLNFFSLKCAKCKSVGCCSRHGYYTRNIVTDEGKQLIEILRVRCKHCKRTHALLPNWIVPYSQILLFDHIKIIRLFEAGKTTHEICNELDHPHIDATHIAYIIKQYRKCWKQRLISATIDIKEEISQLINKCFLKYNIQLMQIKSTKNILFTTNHIA